MKITQQMADQAALIVQAFKEGREVLERVDGSPLRDVLGHIAICPIPDYTYELAPKEPAVCWRNEYSKNDGLTYFGSICDDYAEALRIADGCTNYLRTVKFVEAIE